MANTLYDYGREGFLTGQIDWSTNTIRAVLVDTAQYVVNLNTHRWLSDIPSAARVSTSVPLASKTTTAGIANAASAEFSAVSGNVCNAIAIYKDSGNPSTSRLIAYLTSAVGLPVNPDGSNIEIQWDTSTNKIFKL
jgi:hypothetical protein